MAFEDIINRIQQDAIQKADALKADATKKAKKIIEEAKKKADELEQELKARGEKRASEEELRIITLTRLDIRKRLLKTKQDLIETAFSKAYKNLVNMKDNQYKKFIKNIMANSIETGEEVIIAPGNGRFNLTKQIIEEINKEMKDKPGKLSLSKEKRNISGGFIIRRGKQEINFSLEAIMNNVREEFEPQVVQILFQEK